MQEGKMSATRALSRQTLVIFESLKLLSLALSQLKLVKNDFIL